jgi:TrmH family RNA methyltransferase
VERIESRQNAVVKRFRALSREGRGADGDVLLDGEHLLEEALASGIPVDVAAFSRSHIAGSDRRFAALADRALASGARVLAASDDVFAALSPVRQPSGVAAIARIQPVELASLFRPGPEPPLVLVIAGVQDPGNVGAIVRSAAAFGASGVVVTDGGASPFGWKALRGAMGGTFRVPVASGVSIENVLGESRGANVDLVAAVPSGGTPLPATRLDAGCAIVLGAEGAGVPDRLIAAAGVHLTIPMRGRVESLNVATAAALILYEASRQRVKRR